MKILKSQIPYAVRADADLVAREQRNIARVHNPHLPVGQRGCHRGFSPPQHKWTSRLEQTINELRTSWPANPEKPKSRPHWSANESLVRPHRAAFRDANREYKNSLVMAAMLGMTLDELRS